MIDQVKAKYSHCDLRNCHEEFLTSFFINDNNNGKCVATSIANNATCFIENSKKVNIDFIAIDECLIIDDTIEKCDALVIKDKVIWFIELKEITRTSNRREFSKRKKKYRKKATSQIASTINDLKAKGINFSGYFVAGLICFPPFSSLSMPMNIPTTSSQTRILQFQNLCGFSEIHEGNYLVL